MKVLHVVPTYLPATRYGGPIYSVHGLCKALADRGHEVHVFTTTVDGDRDSDVPVNTAVDIDGVKVWYFPARFSCGRRAPTAYSFINRLARRLYYSPQMKKVLKSRIQEFDIVHPHSVFLWPTSMAARLAYATNIPYVLSPRGMLVKELVHRKSRWVKTAWLRLIEKRNIEGAAGLHVTSLAEALALDDFVFKLPPVFPIPNGVNEPEYFTHDEVSDDVARIIDGDSYVLYFGRINWEKGLDRLIHAWSEVPGWRLVIAGNDEEGFLSKLVTLARERGITERIHFIPRSISGSGKEALMQSASLLVLPSYSENFGNVVLESMIRGVPVVVTEEVGAKDVVIESESGIVVPAEHLGASINELLSDHERRFAMGKKGREWVSENLTWNNVAVQVERCYREVLGQH